jgi:hypothetical protein
VFFWVSITTLKRLVWIRIIGQLAPCQGDTKNRVGSTYMGSERRDELWKAGHFDVRISCRLAGSGIISLVFMRIEIVVDVDCV